MNGKIKNVLMGTGIAFGAVMIALGAYGLSRIGKEKPLDDSDYTEWVVTLAPTCEEEGLESRSLLSSPSVVETRSIPALGHSWGAWEEITEATCLIDGVKKSECSVCHNYDYAAIPALGHDWKEWETEREADCLTEGYDTRVCKRDETHTDYRVTKALGHDWSAWVTTLSPTCTASGTQTRYCRNCNDHLETRTVEALGHAWGPTVVTKPATCTEDGEEKRVCGNDASHFDTYTVKAKGHSYGDWVTAVAATESEDGEEIHYCKYDASHTETRITYAVGSDGIDYTLNAAGTAYGVKCRYPYPTGTVYIPAYHDGLPVTALANSAFSSCRDMERVVFLGNNLKEVGSSAFQNCDKLESVEFPEGVTYIKTHVFYRCGKLKSVSFPSTVTHLGLTYGDHGSFVGVITSCPMLERITIAEGNEVYKIDGDCIIEKATNYVLGGTKNAVIPNYATVILRGSFMGSGIENLHIPASVSKIVYGSFQRCESLKNITFESGELKALGGQMGGIFSDCPVERIELPDSITEIGRYAFDSCTSLREVVFGGNLQTIGADAFKGCYAIEVCELPASVTAISGTSFSSTVVSSLTINPRNTTYIKDGNCIIDRATNVVLIGANDVVIPDYVTGIADHAFYERSIERIIIPSRVQFIGGAAFGGCTALKSVTFEIGSNLESVGASAFSGCTNLVSILLPKDLREIGGQAFYNCKNLSSVTFGYNDGMFVYGISNLESIGDYAFERTALKSFEIPATVTKIGYSVFSECFNLTLKVDEKNEAYKMSDGCLYEIATDTVLYASKEASVPEGAKRIERYAFDACKSAILEISASLLKVEHSAFYGWTKEQTIIVNGFASEEEADAAWGSSWRYGCNATIVYKK